MEKNNIGNPIYNTENKPPKPTRTVDEELIMNVKLEINRKQITLNENPKCVLFRRKLPAFKPTANPT